ncbi:uncharacterized protein LOC116247217 isoform X2 [Nymphaea colorata]|uniref:uncharacterized protein LOC116247217 isoform X2 n=1 Tax=Nymphaea colorata TaxID=210225 RepID=UPI00129D5F08|nr:uncharacterized protein LOC116247217 isoform X2 [Nymphaea colorata]
MEAETTVSGIGHQKENRKVLICEESAVDKFHETLLELTSSITKQNPDEKIQSPQPDVNDSFDLVNVAKDTERNSSLENVKVETSEKFMEAQAVMSTEVQTEVEKKKIEGEEFCGTPSEAKVVSVISSDEYGPAETLDLNLEENNEHETYASTLATRRTPRMQIQIQKDRKECAAETSEILADEFPQKAQAQHGNVSSILIKEKSAVTGLFVTAEGDNLMKCSKPTYSKQSESEIRRNEDQKEAEQENISSIPFQQNSTIPTNLPHSLIKGEESNFFELVEAIHEIRQKSSEDEKPEDVGLSPPGNIIGAIPVEEQHFCKEISSIYENPTPENDDNRENMDSGDSTFSKNLMLVTQEKCELDEANKESIQMLNRHPHEDIRSVADEWIWNATKELEEAQIVETIEDGLNEKKLIGTEYKKICESLSEEGNAEPINQGNTITKEIQLTKETMNEKLKTPFYAEKKEERSSLNAKEGEYSEESHYLSSESSGCKDINSLENVTDGKSRFPSDKGVNEKKIKSEELREAHLPSMISSTKELPIKEGQIQETGAEICDSAEKQLKEVLQKLDKETDDLYLQQPSADVDLQKTSIRGGGKEKASETEYVEEDIEMDGVDKRLNEEVAQFIKEEMTSETIDSLSTEGSNMKIIGVIGKGNIDASKFSHEELMSQNQDITKSMNRVHNDDLEEVTEILIPDIEKERENNDLCVKCASDTIRDNPEQKQTIFVEETEKTICSELKDYKHGADDMNEKKVLTDDGTSQQAICEQKMQKDGTACKFVPAQSVPQATAESSDEGILPTKEEAVENITADNEKDGELLKGVKDLNAEQALELISLSHEKLQKNIQFSETEALSSNMNVDDDVNEEISITSSTSDASTGEMVDKEKMEEVDEHFVLVSSEKALEKIPNPTSAGMKEEVVEENEGQGDNQEVLYATPSKEGTTSQQEVKNKKLDDGPSQEATEKQNQTITDVGYIHKETFLQNEDENVTVFQSSIESFYEVERIDGSPNSPAPICTNLHEASSEVHEEISNFVSEKNYLEIVNERTANNLDTETVQETIEGCAEQKETTFAEEHVETTNSALREYDPEQDASGQAIDEVSLKKDGTNSQEVPYELEFQDANESSLVSLPAQEEMDGNLIQHDEKNDELVERSQNLDAELALERTSLPDTCLEKNHQPLETEPLSQYVTSDHKEDDESTITSSNLQDSIGKKVDKVKQEEFDETVILVSEEKAPETASGSMKDAVIESNKEQDSNQYASYITPSTKEASSQQGKIEIKIHNVPKAATEEQTQATTDKGYNCKEKSLQNEDENITAHQDSLTEKSLKGPNSDGYPVSLASVDNNLQKDETSCQMHERRSNFMSDKRELENADHDEAAADEVAGEEGETDHKNHEEHIKQADEMSTPEVESEYKMTKEETLDVVPEEQDTEAGYLKYGRIHESLEQKHIPDESSHRDYLETVIKNNESATNESKHSDNLNKEEIINEVLLDKSIPEFQSQEDLNIVKEIVKGAIELGPEGQDHKSCNENWTIASENDTVKCKNLNELDILDETVHFEPVVHVKSEQNLKVVDDGSGQGLVSSEPLPIEKKFPNGIEACEISSISDTIQCESPKKSDNKDVTCHGQPVFQAQTEEDMHLIGEHNGKPKDDSETVSKEETSESCAKMTDIKTSNIQRSMDTQRGKDTLEDEVPSETDSSALCAAQLADQQQREDSENVHKSNFDEQQVDYIITGTCAEELAVLVKRTEAYSSCHEDKRVDEELDGRNKTVYTGNNCETNYTQVPTHQETLQIATQYYVEEAERPDTVPEPASLDQSSCVMCNAHNETTEIVNETSLDAMETIESNTRNEGVEGLKQEETLKLDIEQWNHEIGSTCEGSMKQKFTASPISKERLESPVKASSIDGDNTEEARFLNDRSTYFAQISQDSKDEAVVGDRVNVDKSSIYLDRESPKITPSTNEEKLYDSTGQEKEVNGNISDTSVMGGQTLSCVDIAEACELQGANESVSEDKQQVTNTKATEIHTSPDERMEEQNFESSTITLEPVEGHLQTANEEKVEEDRTTISEEHAQEHTSKKENIEDDTYQYEQGTGLSFVPATGECEANSSIKEEDMVAIVEKRKSELSEDEENANKNLEQLSIEKESIAHILQNKISEKLIKMESTGSSIQFSQETMEKLEGKNPEQMSSIQDIPLVESKEEDNSLLKMMQTEACTDHVKIEGTDSHIHCPTMEKLVEHSNLEIVKIPEDTNSVVQDIPQVEVDKQEDSTKKILQTKDSKHHSKDIEDIPSSTHDSIGEVLQEDMKLEDCSIKEHEKETPKEATIFEDKSKVEVEKKQDSIVGLAHRESTDTQDEKVSTNRIQDSNEETSRGHVGKLVEACGLKLQEGTLEQAASLIDILQVEARMQDDSFEVQEERTKVFIKDGMDILSTNHEALRVISQEHVNSPTDSSPIEHQMEIPTEAVHNIQPLGDNWHEYASQSRKSSNDLEVIQDLIQESVQKEMENKDHPHSEIQKVTLKEPTAAEDTRCLEGEKREHAVVKALKEERTQNLVKKETADLCSFSATMGSTEDIIQDCKDNPSKPSNLKLQEETPEKKPSVEETSQLEIENEKDLTKETIEMVSEILQEHPDLLQEAPNKELRLPPIQDSLQMEEQEEECSALNMKVHSDLEHDNQKRDELQPCFKITIEEGNIHGEKTEMDHEKHVKSLELESEEETSKIIEISRNTDIEDQPGGESNLSSMQASTDASIKTEESERETQGEVLEADPLGPSHLTNKNNENHDMEILRERFTPENVQEAQNENGEKEELKGPAADQVELGSLSSDKIEDEKKNSFSFLVSEQLKDEILEASETKEIKTTGTNHRSGEVAEQDSSVVLLEEEKKIEEPLSPTHDKISTTVRSPDVSVNQAKFETASLDKTEDEKLDKTILVHDEQNSEILESSSSRTNKTVNGIDEDILVQDSGVEISSEDKKIEATYQTEHGDPNQETLKVNRESHDSFKDEANSEPSQQETTVSLRASGFKLEDQLLLVPILVQDEKVQESRSLELDKEDGTSDTTKSSRITQKKAQKEAENNMFTTQPSLDAGLKVDKSTTQVQQKVLNADSMEQGFPTIGDSETPNENALIEELTSKSMEERSTQHDTSKREESEGIALEQVQFEISLSHEKIDTMSILVSEKPKGESPEASFQDPVPNQAELEQLDSEINKVELQLQGEQQAESVMDAGDHIAQIGQVAYSDGIKRETGTKASEEETTVEVMSKEDSKKHEHAPNPVSNEQIHILTDAKEHKISKDDQMAALISMTHEEEEKVQDSGNKLQKNSEGADLTEEEIQNASGTRKSIDLGCQNEENPSYTKVMPLIQASIKEMLPIELEESPAGISNLVSEEEINELIGAKDDTDIKSDITKDNECTDFQVEEDEIDIQVVKEDIIEIQRPMTVPEVAIDKQSLDGIGPSFTKETMKVKDGEINVEKDLNIDKLTDSSSEEQTTGSSLGIEEQDQERSKVNNHVELMTMKDDENDNLPFPSETTIESGISTEKNKEAVQEVSLPVNEEHTRERVEVSKKIEIQDFQNDEALHKSATQLATKEVLLVETEKVLEISNLVTELQQNENDKTNLEYDNPMGGESKNLSSKMQVMSQRSSQDEEANDVKTLDANLPAEILQSSYGESLDSTISKEEKRSDENLFSFSDMHASTDKISLKHAKDEVPPSPLPEPEIASCRSIYESEHLKTCVQDEIDLQEEAVVSTEKEKKYGEEFDRHPEVLTKCVAMVDGNQELNSWTEIAAETQYEQSDDQPAREIKMSSQKVNENREGKPQTQADQACFETIEGRQVTDSGFKDIILQKEENEVDQQGLVQEVVEKIEKEDASEDRKPEEIGRTIIQETKATRKDLEIVDNVSEQAQSIDLGKTSGEENMKMGAHFMEGKQCAVDDSSDNKPTLCTGLLCADKSAEEREEEEHKHEESGFEAPAGEVSLKMKSMADVKDYSLQYKTDIVQTDSVHPEKSAGSDEEQSKQESGSASPVLEEPSGATDHKPAHKKHNILSSVGSKVKHSIGKVKKAITGKSSHHKPHSPKA